MDERRKSFEMYAKNKGIDPLIPLTLVHSAKKKDFVLQGMSPFCTQLFYFYFIFCFFWNLDERRFLKRMPKTKELIPLPLKLVHSAKKKDFVHPEV
jgi:hypothetical protein